MPHQSANEIITQQEALAAERMTWDSHWGEVAELVLPRQDDFLNKRRIGGEKRAEKQADGLPALALDRFAAIFDSLLTPRSTRWHGVRHPNPKVYAAPDARQYYDDMTELLFQVRYAPSANFAGQNYEGYYSLGAFGNRPMEISDLPGHGINYKTHHLSTVFIMEGLSGLVDTIYHRYELTAKIALEKFDSAKLSEQIKTADESGNGAEKFEFIRCVRPNSDFRPGLLGSQFMRFTSTHVEVAKMQTLELKGGPELKGNVVRSSGHRVFPYTFGRYVTAPTEIYGRGVAMMMLPAIKVLNQIKLTALRAGHNVADPAILLADDGKLRFSQIVPGHGVVGGLDEQGRPRAVPFNTGARLDVAEGMAEVERQTIRDGFLMTLFEILADHPQMTATEVLERAQQRGALTGPMTGRQETEVLGPQIEIELDILAANNALPQMPQIVQDNGGLFEVFYTNPATRLRRSEEALGTQRVVQAAMEISQFVPNVLDIINFEESLKITAEAEGAPGRIFTDPEIVKAIRDAREQQQLMEALAEAAPGLSRAGLDVARTEKTDADREAAAVQ